MDKTLCQTRPDWENPSFEDDKISPCNACAFPVPKIISDGMWPVNLTGHTVCFKFLALSFLLQRDMIKCSADEIFSIKSFISYGYTTKINFCLKKLHHAPVTANTLFFSPFKSFIVKYL